MMNMSFPVCLFVCFAEGTDETPTVKLVKSSVFSYEQAWHRYIGINHLPTHVEASHKTKESKNEVEY